MQVFFQAGYLKCLRLVKLEFLNHSQEVVMLDNAEVHFHQVDKEYLTGGKKYLWTKRQEDIILPLAGNRATATVILR